MRFQLRGELSASREYVVREHLKLVVPPSQNISIAMSLGIAAAGITAGTPAIQNAIVAALRAALACPVGPGDRLAVKGV